MGSLFLLKGSSSRNNLKFHRLQYHAVNVIRIHVLMTDNTEKKTPYSDEELEHFKRLLNKEKQEARDEIKELKSNIEGIEEQEGDQKSAQAHHSGNIGSEEEEKETFYTLISRQKEKIKRIDEALNRIEYKTYGVCQETGKKIQKARLESIPYAAFSVEASERNDAQNQPPKV